MNTNYLKVVMAVMFAVGFGGLAGAEESPAVNHVAGEIAWVDTKLGLLQLQEDSDAGKGEVLEYRITKNETIVTNASDNKFLSVLDLQPGQHVIVDVIYGQEEKIVQKITADPKSASNFQEAYGEVESIDASGTFTLAVRSQVGDERVISLSYFVFEPKNIIVMQSPSRQPVELLVKTGDVVKVEYVVKDGKQHARSITMYSPRVTRTTTTTTVTTTQ